MIKSSKHYIPLFTVSLMVFASFATSINQLIIASCEIDASHYPIQTKIVTRHQEPWERTKNTSLLEKEKCNRFSYFKCTFESGLGHRFGEIVMGMLLANKINTTFVFDDTCWTQPGFHGGYEWFPAFFPIHDSEFSLSELRQLNFTNSSTQLVEFHGSWENVVEKALETKSEDRLCNIIFSSHWTKCPHGSCFESPIVGCYEDVKWRLRAIYARSRFEPQTRLFENSSFKRTLSLAWHVRSGDIVLHNNAVFYQNLGTQLRDVLFGIPFQVFFFGENVLREFPFLPDVCRDVFNLSCSFPVVQPDDTLYHFLHADILVSSGSSFPIVAAVLRDTKPSFSVMPKEGSRIFYSFSDEIRVSETGIFENDTSWPEIRARMVKLSADML